MLVFDVILSKGSGMVSFQVQFANKGVFGMVHSSFLFCVFVRDALDPPRHNAIRMLECCVKYGARIIVSSDAHAECDILRHTSALALLRETGFPEELVVNRSAELAIAALHEKRCGQRV